MKTFTFILALVAIGATPVLAHGENLSSGNALTSAHAATSVREKCGWFHHRHHHRR